MRAEGASADVLSRPRGQLEAQASSASCDENDLALEGDAAVTAQGRPRCQGCSGRGRDPESLSIHCWGNRSLAVFGSFEGIGILCRVDGIPIP